MQFFVYLDDVVMVAPTQGCRCPNTCPCSCLLLPSISDDVLQVIVSGTSYDVCVRALELTRQYPGVFYTTIGVHPAHSLEFDESGDPQGHLDKLRKLITENRDVVVAIGEIGIDYAELEECPKDVQVLVPCMTGGAMHD